MNAIIPRVVVITRETEYEMLLARHATRGQVEFFLRERGQSLDLVLTRHARQQQALKDILSAIPTDWRRNLVKRNELDRFLFEPDDLIIAVGQDGLVANMAKYLNGQRVLGVNPDSEQYEGILVPFSSNDATKMLQAAMYEAVDTQRRTLAEVKLDDGQRLLALNELFIGHHSHQSARYQLTYAEQKEHQSSSGIIVSTGTGATGWARSIKHDRHDQLQLPQPEDDWLNFYVREAFPSQATGTELTAGPIDMQHRFEIRSEINEGGIIFGDGIETDYLPFNWGMRATFAIAKNKLELVNPINH